MIKLGSSVQNDATRPAGLFDAAIGLAIVRVTIGVMFVSVFVENLGKGTYTAGGYAGVINYYIKSSHSPAVWKAVMSLGVSNAAIAAPLQALTEISLGVLLVIGAVSNALGEVVDGYDAWGLHAAAVAPAAQVRLFDLLDNSAAALPVSFLAVPVMAIGLVVAMAGVLRARVAPWWLPALVIAGGLVAGFAGSGPLALIGLVWSLGTAAVVLLVARGQRASSTAA